jgi:hypothetical protein
MQGHQLNASESTSGSSNGGLIMRQNLPPRQFLKQNQKVMQNMKSQNMQIPQINNIPLQNHYVKQQNHHLQAYPADQASQYAYGYGMPMQPVQQDNTLHGYQIITVP